MFLFSGLDDFNLSKSRTSTMILEEKSSTLGTVEIYKHKYMDIHLVFFLTENARGGVLPILR